MQEIAGIRENTVRYIYEGYEYHIDTTSPHIYRCATRRSTGCRGAARVDAEGVVTVYRPHEGHEANETAAEEARMRQEMLNLAAETNDPPKEIFDRVCRRNPAVAPKLNFATLKSAMQRVRVSLRPATPATLQELGAVLNDYVPTRNIYRGLVEGNDGSVAVVFASDQMLRHLEDTTEIYVDGTFKVVPNNPPITQLYTIHMRVMDTGVAAVFCLCSAKTRILYVAIFRKLTELAPGITESLRFAMGDYERAAMGALHEIFPEASLHGCWFHFKQALLRRWRYLGLSNAPPRVLGMAMALPLAPSDQFGEGLRLLAGLADEIAIGHPNVLQFLSYLRRQWGPLADVVSVHGCPIRTNNFVESFHNEAKRKLGGLHPNIWKFIEHLTDLIANQDIELQRLGNGDLARRARTRRNMARDTVITNAQHSLSVGRFTLREFLERCATRAGAADLVGIGQQDFDEGADDDNHLVQPGLLAAAEPVRVVDDPDIVQRNHDDGNRGRRGRGRGGRRGIRGARNRVAAMPRNAELLVEPGEQPEQVRGDNEVARDDLENRGRRGRGRGARRGVRGARNGAAALPRVPELPVEPVVPEEQAEQARAQEPLEIPNNDVLPAPHGDGDNDQAPLPAGVCCVCLIEPATHAFIPCGHRCCCGVCAERIAVRCPLCRQDSLGVFRIRI